MICEGVHQLSCETIWCRYQLDNRHDLKGFIFTPQI